MFSSKSKRSHPASTASRRLLRSRTSDRPTNDRGDRADAMVPITIPVRVAMSVAVTMTMPVAMSMTMTAVAVSVAVTVSTMPLPGNRCGREHHRGGDGNDKANFSKFPPYEII